MLQHLDKAQRCLTAGEAEQVLKSCWPSYAKGGEFPKWLIDRTDKACERERPLLGGPDQTREWPSDRSSQMPRLIAYLDERALALRQAPPGKR